MVLGTHCNTFYRSFSLVGQNDSWSATETFLFCTGTEKLHYIFFFSVRTRNKTKSHSTCIIMSLWFFSYLLLKLQHKIEVFESIWSGDSLFFFLKLVKIIWTCLHLSQRAQKSRIQPRIGLAVNEKEEIKWRILQFWDEVLTATVPCAWRPHLHPLCCLLVAITMEVQRVKIQWHSCRYRDVISCFEGGAVAANFCHDLVGKLLNYSAVSWIQLQYLL